MHTHANYGHHGDCFFFTNEVAMGRVIVNMSLLYPIQVFLHPKQELPQVRDLGFAIAPGVHALIAVRLNEVSRCDCILVGRFLMLTRLA